LLVNSIMAITLLFKNVSSANLMLLYPPMLIAEFPLVKENLLLMVAMLVHTLKGVRT